MFVEVGLLVYYLNKIDDPPQTQSIVIADAISETIALLVGAILTLYFGWIAYKGHNWLMERDGCEKV
jgi:hypothetical protein